VTARKHKQRTHIHTRNERGNDNGNGTEREW
jgi:hypothetical protein